MLNGNPAEVVVDVPKLNPPVVVAVRENPVVGATVVPVFEASNDSPGAAAVAGVPLGRLKLGTLGADVVVAIAPPRPKPVAVVMVFGVPKVRPVVPGRRKRARVSIPSRGGERYAAAEDERYLP